MQNATGSVARREAGAVVQRDPDVVVSCDRCPRELRSQQRSLTGRVDDVMPEYRAKWTELVVQTGMDVPKLLTLCPDCTRQLRLFMLGCTGAGLRIERQWEAVVCGAV